MTDHEGLSRPTSGAGRLQRIVLELLEGHVERGEVPTSIRFLFYELEQAGLAFKPEKGKRRGGVSRPSDIEVGEAVTHLRKVGLVPWGWIADETRTLHDWASAASVADFLVGVIRKARINPWGSEPPLILCESRSLVGVLRSLAMEFVCPITATNGQALGFLMTEVAPILQGNDRTVLYLGDWDHHGHQIEENSRSVLKRGAGREIDWTRLAITEEQIAERSIEPILKKDGRLAWETEALGQGVIVRMVREALDSSLPEALDSVLARERVERRAMTKLLTT